MVQFKNMTLVNKYRERAVATLNEKLINNHKYIEKLGSSWVVIGKDDKYWPIRYKSKHEASRAVRSYLSNKLECLRPNTHRRIFESFTEGDGKELIRNVQYFLMKIFGHALYFDRVTDKSAVLFYKGKMIAELVYKNRSQEILIVPDNTDIAPESFYDTSEYEIQDYLSDLILGDV